MAIPRSATLLACFGVSVNLCIVAPKLVWQCMTNILSMNSNLNNSCYLLSLEGKITCLVNCCVSSWAELFSYWQRLFDLSSTQVVLAYDIKATFENWSSTILKLQEAPWRLCISLLTGKGCNDKRQVVIHIVHFKLQFSSKMSPAHIIYIANVLTVLLLEHFRMALIPYRSNSGPNLLNHFYCFGP